MRGFGLFLHFRSLASHQVLNDPPVELVASRTRALERLAQRLDLLRAHATPAADLEPAPECAILLS